MAISYNKLWKLLIDKNMNKTEMASNCGISRNTLARMGKSMHVSTDVLERICKKLDCELNDIVEIKKDTSD